VPARHEGGTPNVVGAVALAAACRFVDSLPAGAVREHAEHHTGRGPVAAIARPPFESWPPARRAGLNCRW